MASLVPLIAQGTGQPTDIPHFLLHGLSPNPDAPDYSSALTVGGTSEAVDKFIRNWSVDDAANARSVMSCDILSLDGSYRAVLDQEIHLIVRAERIFAGLVNSVVEKGIGDVGLEKIVNQVRANDFNALADRHHINDGFPAGTLKSILTRLVDAHLWPFNGISLDPAQVDGPVLPEIVSDWEKASELLDFLSVQTGGVFVWEIDFDRVLRMYEPVVNAAPFNITVPNCLATGDVTVEPTRQDYANYIIVRTPTLSAYASDAAEIAARQLWTAVYTTTDPTTQADLDALAATILARSIVTLKKVTYTTYTPGLRSGMSQQIVLPTRNLNNTFLITAVRMSSAGTKNEPDRVRYDVTAVEGLVYRPGWRETWRSMFSSGKVVSGGVSVGTGGGGSGSTTTRNVVNLGGNGIEATSCPTTSTWMPASGGGTSGNAAIQPQISTVARGTTAATITARLRALRAGVGVQARLFDATTGLPCAGVSAVVTSTNWQTVTWGVTLTPGADYYELQLLATVANSPIAATAYLE